MHELKGRNLPLTGPRRFIIDLVHFARQIPSTPVSRPMDVSALIGPARHASGAAVVGGPVHEGLRPGGRRPSPLASGLLEFPWPRLYEHPWMNCAWRSSGRSRSEQGVFVGLFRAPEQQTLGQLQEALAFYKSQPLEEVGFYRRAMCVSRGPTPVRRLLWWSTLHVSGYKRAKRFGTFGLTSYGALGAESLHPISPLTTT